MRLVLNLLALVCLGVLALVGLGYRWLSPGLAAPSATDPFFCRELQSAGVNDDAMIAVFGLFALPLFMRLLRLRQRVQPLELALFGTCAAAVVMALWLASLDCARIFYTVFQVPDLALAAALLALPGALVSLLLLRRG